MDEQPIRVHMKGSQDSLPLLPLLLLNILNLLPFTEAGCGGVFTSPTGVLTSPGYPAPYPIQQECLYIVRREEGEAISLTFHELELESQEECVADILEIRDGDSEKAPVRFMDCGSNSAPDLLTSFTSTLWIKFTSDASGSAGGFKITYTTATAQARRQFFLLSTPKTIHIMHRERGGSMILPIPGVYNPVGLELDPVQQRVYWSDQGLGEIRSAFLNGSDLKTVYTHQIQDFSFRLALDPVARLLFFAESYGRKILMASLLTGDTTTILSTASEPRSIALDYSQGLLFWMDAGLLTPSISRALYDGTQRRTIVTRHLLSPRSLNVDRTEKRLYWLDASSEKVEWCDYEGKGRSSQVARFRDTYFFSLAVTDRDLHVADWGSEGTESTYSTLHRLDKDGSNASSTAFVSNHVQDFIFRQEATGPAEDNGCGGGENGGCSHFCLPLDDRGHTRCHCPERHVLSADRRTCTAVKGTAPGSRSAYKYNYFHVSDDAYDDDDNDDDDDDDDDEIEILSRLTTVSPQRQSPTTPPPPQRSKIPAKNDNPSPGRQGKPLPTTTIISEDDYESRAVTAAVVMVGPEPFHTDGSKELGVVCVREDKEVSAAVWSTGRCKLDGNVCRFKPRVPEDDGLEIRCEVYYIDGTYGRDSFTLKLNYPPPSPPQIEGYTPGKTLRVGNPLRMTCIVKGGKPLVSAVDFYCAGHPDDEPDEESLTYVQASVTIERLMSSDDGVTCVCSAEWKMAEMYTKKTSVTLRVKARGRTEL